MKLRIFSIVVAALLCGLLGQSSYGQGETEAAALKDLARSLADRLVARDQPRLAVLDFTDLQGRTNVEGRYLAEQLDVLLANVPGITVLDRRNTARLMEEHQLTAEGLINPENAKKLGQFAGVQSVLIGSFTISQENVVLITKAVSTETSEILAASQVEFPATDDDRIRADTALDSTTRPGAGPSSTASATEGAAIATREVGPITAVLRNVAAYAPQDQTNAAPSLRCTFDLENRSLGSSVAVAFSQRVRETYSDEPEIVAYRGALADSNRTSWTLTEISGVPAVACFESTGGRNPKVTQPNPAGIVNYIRAGRRYDGSTIEARGRYWTGSFGSIPPGEKIRVTLDFMPSDMLGQRSSRSRDRALWEAPSHFQLDIELVLATSAEGEDPAKSKDLMLRNLTIDRVVLPDQSTAP